MSEYQEALRHTPVFNLVNTTTADTQRHDMQLFYLQWIVESREVHMNGVQAFLLELLPRDQRVASALSAEILRLSLILKELKSENLLRDFRSQEADDQLGFLT